MAGEKQAGVGSRQHESASARDLKSDWTRNAWQAMLPPACVSALAPPHPASPRPSACLPRSYRPACLPAFLPRTPFLPRTCPAPALPRTCHLRSG